MTEVLTPELEARLDAVPKFAGRPRTVETLTGGLTNVNLKVTTPEGCYVARLSSPEGELLAIDREAEHRNSVAAWHSGVGMVKVLGRSPIGNSNACDRPASPSLGWTPASDSRTPLLPKPSGR